MNLINIDTALVFNRALKKYNSKSGNNFKVGQVFLLLAVRYCNKDFPCTEAQIFQFMKSNFRTCSRNTIRLNLSNFVVQHLVIKLQGYPSKYTASVSGTNLLNAIEKSLRGQRTSKKIRSPK